VFGLVILIVISAQKSKRALTDDVDGRCGGIQEVKSRSRLFHPVSGEGGEVAAMVSLPAALPRYSGGRSMRAELSLAQHAQWETA
jgi:hypothetical protein